MGDINIYTDTPISTESISFENQVEGDIKTKFQQKTLQDYEVISVIGNGTFGTCFKVRDKATGEVYAWKGMDYDELSEAQKQSLVSEINVLRQLQHPNIVQYYHHLVNYEAKSIFIVMECCEGGDLAQLITRARAERRRFEEKYVWRVLHQLCKALQVCHNKFSQGTLLHRDIKPANIFLDAQGNAKLGDFGLARLLQRNESFTRTFVGTPYYMSPELVKGSCYGRKSDVWALGCLIYELCALRPPFRAPEFAQLYADISNGQYASVPQVYSSDLHEIITYMLAVDNVQRPTVEIIARHPLLVRNIHELGSRFPQLLPAEEDLFYREARCKLLYNDLSSTLCSEVYDHQRLSLSSVFTPEVRLELLCSIECKSQMRNQRLQRSDPTLYESIRQAADTTDEELPLPRGYTDECSTTEKKVSTNTAIDMLWQRLQAIAAQEEQLKQKTLELDRREEALNGKALELAKLELKLQLQATEIANKTELKLRTAVSKRTKSVDRNRVTRSINSVSPPPLPPRKPTSHDDTYCSVEPNDSFLQAPTVAKLNLATLQPTKSFPSLRKVTFQSPKKFITYDIENLPLANKVNKAHTLKTNTNNNNKNNNPMRASVSSKGSSDDSNECNNNNMAHRRKSILSIFGLYRGHKETSKTPENMANTQNATVKLNSALHSSQINSTIKTTNTNIIPTTNQILSKCETAELSTMWTKEHKRAAFDLLAAMNETEQKAMHGQQQKFRHSMRVRNTMQRQTFRQSLIAPAKKSVAVTNRERVLI